MDSKRSSVRGLALLAFSAALTGWHYLHVRPLDRPLLDDTAIILKYLDNVRGGCFYCYNRADGPVFGISGFVHGLLTGALVAAGVRPEPAVIVSNIVGSMAFYAVCVLLLRRAYGSAILAVAGTLVVFAASVYARETFMTGMETPLHAAIVFGAVLAFLARSPMLDLLCAVAIVSKLDACAPVAVLLGLDLARSLLAGVESFRPRLRRLALGFCAPLAAWIGYALLEFGSPLPQTFLAKQFFHPKAVGGSFPFLSAFYDVSELSSDLIVSCGAAAIVIAVFRRALSPSAVLALCGVAILVPYFFYNPGEQMHWYYTMPELFFLSAAVAFPAAIAEAVPQGHRIGVLATAVCVASCGLLLRSLDSEDLLRWSRGYAVVVESDRIAAGRALRDATAPGAIVYAGHGHIARESHRRVIDLTGLNSRFATDHRLELPAMFADAPPAGVAIQGLLPEDLQRKYHLELRQSFYNVTSLAGPPFRVFSQSAHQARVASLVPSTALVAGNWERDTPPLIGSGPLMELRLEDLRARRMTFGVRAGPSPRTLLIKGTGVGENQLCDVPAAPADCSACTIECTVDARDHQALTSLKIGAADGEPVTIVAPAVLRDSE